MIERSSPLPNGWYLGRWASQHEPLLERFRRDRGESWQLFEAGPGKSQILTSVDVALETDEVYRTPLG